MAASVEARPASPLVSQPNLVTREEVTKTLPPKAQDNAEPKVCEGDEQKQEGKNGKGEEGQKPKIFDNKNFVEAPLPKTNPWRKSTAAPAQAPPPPQAPVRAPSEPKSGNYDPFSIVLFCMSLWFFSGSRRTSRYHSKKASNDYPALGA